MDGELLQSWRAHFVQIRRWMQHTDCTHTMADALVVEYHILFKQSNPMWSKTCQLPVGSSLYNHVCQLLPLLLNCHPQISDTTGLAITRITSFQNEGKELRLDHGEGKQESGFKQHM